MPTINTYVIPIAITPNPSGITPLSINIPKQLGVTEVSVAWDPGSFNSSVKVENLSSNAITAACTKTRSFVFSITTGPFISSASYAHAFSRALTAYDGTLDYSGTSGAGERKNHATAVSAVKYTDDGVAPVGMLTHFTAASGLASISLLITSTEVKTPNIGAGINWITSDKLVGELTVDIISA